MYRTMKNGEPRLEDAGKALELVGWVAKKRNFGQLCFVDLRDVSGICQIVFNEAQKEALKDVKPESILHVKGTLRERQDKNPSLPTGDVELAADEFEIINNARPTPLLIADETDALEDTRLQYRYLDLRRPVMQEKLKMRHAINRSIRHFLDEHDFIEVETPMLGKSTPEGARDYLVPSRVHPGSFYALPQSPQLYKQLLMIAGLDRYYQIAKCFRDEDLRADRQTDFTQVDIEMSFMSEEEIMALMEEMLAGLMKEVKDIEIPVPFEKLPWTEAMNRYGSDKPDTRFGMELMDVKDLFADTQFPVFAHAQEEGKAIKGILAKDYQISNKEVKKLTDFVKKNGAGGLVVLKAEKDDFSGPARKFLSEAEIKALKETTGAENGDTLFFVADDWKKACTAAGALRDELARRLDLKKKDEFAFLWVTDFPMFEYSEQEGRYVSEHHPFTMPKKEDLPLLDSHPELVKTNAYDCVLNGYELGGGSLRIYDNNLQKKIFKILGLSDEQIRQKFGFFVDAFQYGTPPHGGLAFGLDRIAMILSGSDSIRDVIAFPKNAAARCPMSGAPAPVEPEQLDELKIAVVQPEEQ